MNHKTTNNNDLIKEFKIYGAGLLSSAKELQVNLIDEILPENFAFDLI